MAEHRPLASIEAVESGLAAQGYIASRQIATAVYLAQQIEKPILVEGPAGVGKTELAKAIAAWRGLKMIRLQCYEGLDEAKALYEWKYAKQLLYTQILKDKLGDPGLAPATESGDSHVVARDVPPWQVGVDGDVDGDVGRHRHRLTLQLPDRVDHHLAVEVETDRRDVPGLRLPQEVAGAADLEVAHGDLEPRAEVGELADRLQALVRLLTEHAVGRVQEVGVGALAAPPDAADSMLLPIERADDNSARRKVLDPSLPDVLVQHAPGCLAQMIDAARELDGNANILAVEEVPKERVHMYGVVGVGAPKGKTFAITKMVEKPKASEAPSNLTITGRYILQPQIFELLEKQAAGTGGEIQLTDAMLALSRSQPFYGLKFEGRSFDCGSKIGFLAANVAYGLERADIAPELRSEMRRLLDEK